MGAFPAVRIEGGLLAPDLLEEVLAGQLSGQRPGDFGLPERRSLTDEVAAAFAEARAHWTAFTSRLARLPEADPATTVTRDSWVIPLLSLLGYEPHYQPRAHAVDGLTFAISHRADGGEEAPPVHIVGARQELGRLAPSGRPRLAPHSLLQEYLNRTEHLWGIVTNGLTLRVLRDSTFVRRQAYLEFDLPAILEEQRFSDFTLLYRLLHRTRLPRGTADAPQCLLEQYHQHSLEQGGRVRERLREGVEECLTVLGNGFLRHPANAALRHRLVGRDPQLPPLSPDELYRQLLRLVYRLLFLMVGEERNLLSANPVYRRHYGLERLRRLVDRRAAYTDHEDLWHGLRVLWRCLADERLAALLDLAPLNGELFAWQELDDCSLSNRDLLSALWHLHHYRDRPGAPPRRVNYAALDVEELGSVYESLLEYHPTLTGDPGSPGFALAFGSERKTTGSYYTPPQLVGELVSSALEPVLRERLDAARTSAEKERAILALKVCDPACGSGHFLLAAARRLGKELARVRTGEEEPAPEAQRQATREVIAHCLYGVDRNPLAVELCRVALWLEGHTGDKPLTFLDHRIRCGDSLLGVWQLEGLRGGIPDEAFAPLEGDDRELARALARRNRSEREGQGRLFPWDADAALTALGARGAEVDAVPDTSPQALAEKKRRYLEACRDPERLRLQEACDLWAAAFFQPLRPGRAAITSAAVLDRLAGRAVPGQLLGAAAELALRHRFFHWPLEFPEVFAAGGFDVVLSNPPWERIKLQEQEFFAARDHAIASAPTRAARARLIRELARRNPALFEEYQQALRGAEAASQFLRHGGRFPLTGRGDINTFAVFAELARAALGPGGRAGIIVPTGIATDDTTKFFFQDLMRSGALASLYDFENRRKIFQDIDSRLKFCLLTLHRAIQRKDVPPSSFSLPWGRRTCAGATSAFPSPPRRWPCSTPTPATAPSSAPGPTPSSPRPSTGGCRCCGGRGGRELRRRTRGGCRFFGCLIWPTTPTTSAPPGSCGGRATAWRGTSSWAPGTATSPSTRPRWCTSSTTAGPPTTRTAPPGTSPRRKSATPPSWCSPATGCRKRWWRRPSPPSRRPWRRPSAWGTERPPRRSCSCGRKGGTSCAASRCPPRRCGWARPSRCPGRWPGPLPGRGGGSGPWSWPRTFPCGRRRWPASSPGGPTPWPWPGSWWGAAAPAGSWAGGISPTPPTSAP